MSARNRPISATLGPKSAQNLAPRRASKHTHIRPCGKPPTLRRRLRAVSRAPPWGPRRRPSAAYAELQHPEPRALGADGAGSHLAASEGELPEVAGLEAELLRALDADGALRDVEDARRGA